MDKSKNVVETIISLINKQNEKITIKLSDKNNFEESLMLLNKTFKEDEMDDFKNLSSLGPDDFEELITLLLKQDEVELKNNINASCFLMKNGIDLVKEQVEKLEDLRYRASIKKRDIQHSVDDIKNNYTILKNGEELIEKLQNILDGGFLDNDIIVKIFETLKMKNDDILKYIDDIIEFNLERINGLNISGDREIELLDIENEDNISEITREDLIDLLQKYGYDSTMFDEELLNLLINEGNVKQFEEVFESLNRNHINFMKTKNSKNAQLLTKFLLESSSEIIDEVADVFYGSSVNYDIIKNYRVAFFKSPEEKLKDEVKKRINKLKGKGENSPVSTPRREGLFNVVGKHNDFVKNLKLLESYGYDRNDLIERQVKLLTTSHSIVKRHIEELQLYEYPIGNKDFPLSTINASNLMDITDRFIELGEEKYIYKYSSRLSAYSTYMTDRIYALKQKGLPYKLARGENDQLLGFVVDFRGSCGLSNEEIDKIIPKDVDKILNGNRYKELLDKYIPSSITNTTLEEPFVKELDDKYMINSKCYNFNGVLISRKKFLRNYEFLMGTNLIPNHEKNFEQILWVSALYNSKLNAEQIEKVDSALMGCITIGGNNGVLKK